MIKVVNDVKVYEIEKDSHIKVCSHWNDRNFVVLEVDGVKFTVLAQDLKAAIDNATNVSKW